MRKLESDIRKAAKKYERAKAEYEKARAALQPLTDLNEVERLDEDGVKPNLQNVRQSEEMGHDSEETTRIYLAQLDTSVVDKANRKIINQIV